MKRVVILQPSYIPWLGYFDQIDRADTFVFFDDVQYTRRDWRNRNRVKLNAGTPGNVTIPVLVKGQYNALINEIRIDNSQDWRRKHLNMFLFNYKKAPFFDEVFQLLEKELVKPHEFLSNLAEEMTQTIAHYLGVQTTFARSSELGITYENPTDHLVQICKKLEATHYLTGDSAANYLDESAFEKNNMVVEYQNYVHPEYEQLWGPFVSHLSIVDVLFNCGKGALAVISNRRAALTKVESTRERSV